MHLATLLADSLRRLRQQEGLSQAEMARRLRISRLTLRRLEDGSHNPTLRVLDQLCRTLRCHPGDLFRPGEVALRTRQR